VVVGYRTRIKSVYIDTAESGTDPVVFHDGEDGNADVLLTVSTASAGGRTVYIPGEGILAENGVYVDLGDATAVTVFYG